MSRCSFGCGLLLVSLALATAAACSSNSSSATGPTTLSAESGARTNLTAEPVTLRPEFLPNVPCSSSPAFGTRVIVVVSGGPGVSVRSLRFRFTDLFGVRALPQVRVIPGSSPMTMPAGMIPPLMGIPIPGLAPPPASTMLQAANAQRFPFFLSFGCGLSTTGIVAISTDTMDRMGRPQTLEISVPLS